MNEVAQLSDRCVPVRATLDTLLDIDGIRIDAETGSLVLALGKVHGRDVAVFILREQPQSVEDLWRLHAFIVAAGSRGNTLIGIHANHLLIDNDGSAYNAQAGLLRALMETSSHAPYLAICAGNLGGVNALLCAQADAVFMTARSGAIYLSDPAAVLAVRGLSVDDQMLGGGRIHGVDSGLAARICSHLADALLQTRRYLGLLGGETSNAALPERDQPQSALATLRPNDHAAYDMRELIANLIDDGDWFELRQHHGAAIITGMARISGMTTGIVANNPRVNAGSLDIAACRKAARFIELCSQRSYAMLSIIDTPGFLPGSEQEASGIVPAVQALIQAWAQSASARVSLLTGRALGGAGIAMGLGLSASDAVIAWPAAWQAASGDSPARAADAEPGQSSQPQIISQTLTRQAVARALMLNHQLSGA